VKVRERQYALSVAQGASAVYLLIAGHYLI
jgi:hypothetical protein